MNRDHANAELQSILRHAGIAVDHGRLEEAETLYLQAIGLMPSNPQIHLVLGLLYLELRRLKAAQSEVEQAIRLKSDYPEAHRGLGHILYARSQFQASIAAYEKALDLDPGHVGTCFNLGRALHRTGRHEAALACFEQILATNAQDPQALNHIGKAFHAMGLPDSAMEYFDRALDSSPEYAEAHYNRAKALLALGEYARGWREFEWRFKRDANKLPYPHQLPTPRWQGEPFAGRKLLVHCERRMADVLQFARYLPLAKQLGGRLILQAHPPLLPLLKFMDFADVLIPYDDINPPSCQHDLHVPLMSLPLILGSDIPKSFPYLKPDPPRCDEWGNRLMAQGLRVGIALYSSPSDSEGILPMDLLEDWFNMPELTFYDLQRGASATGSGSLDRIPQLTAMGGKLPDVAETAAMIHHLDLIISVDNTIAHLAGAMGKPLWMLVPSTPDWRWPSGENGSPWYPHARIFRQFKNDTWLDVVSTVRRELETLRRQKVQEIQSPTLPMSTQPKADRPTGETPGPKINKVLLVSPIYGGSLEVVRYLAAGFQQAGRETLLWDNSRHHAQLRQIDGLPDDDPAKAAMLDRFLMKLDEGVLAGAAQFKPDLVVAIAQSPLENPTVIKLRKMGIVCAYWFVEDYRFRDYWSEIAPAYDLFFMIQRDEQLTTEFAKLGYSDWHYLPLACDPAMHKPWSAPEGSRRTYGCQIGFMGAPYLNRLNIFEKLTDYELKIWGEGWSDYDISQALKACVQEGQKRTTAEESVRIYSSADIVVNLHSSPFVEGISAAGEFVNPRTFEVAGCAGFQLTDYRSELPPLFEPGREIITFHDLEELQALIKYWLPRDDMRRRVALRAQARAYSQHTYRHRAETIMRTVNSGQSAKTIQIP